ncbi:hypothetical protein GCM10008932_11600 [Alkalibacterium iburiense]|uniref:Uncharacterized protein n=1 Tax=Alkalibacterium iburiense TaxID=290589 RepID=A0ABN0XCC7_9LACT
MLCLFVLSLEEKYGELNYFAIIFSLEKNLSLNSPFLPKSEV